MPATRTATAAALASARHLVIQGSLNLIADPDSNWDLLQTVYRLIRDLLGGAASAWATQAITTMGVAIIVWSVWRSEARYPLKAPTLPAAGLIATPYAFADDLAAIAAPIAFLASDRMRCGLLRGEQTMLLALFGTVLAVLVIFADGRSGPLSAPRRFRRVVMIVLLGVALHRAFCRGEQSSAFQEQAIPRTSIVGDLARHAGTAL
jgi:hypothetical protein